MYIFNRSPGPHSRNQMKQLLIDWTTPSSDNSRASEPLLNLLIDDGALRSKFGMVGGDMAGGVRNPEDAAVLALAAEPNDNLLTINAKEHGDSFLDQRLDSTNTVSAERIHEEWDSEMSDRIKSVLQLLVKTFPQTASRNSDLNELVLTCLNN
jgi:hypothetical protein